MSESVEAVGTAYRRRATRDFAVVVATVLAGCLAVALVADVLLAIVAALLATGVLYAPVFRTTEELALTTDRSPRTVREAFAGEDCPLVAIQRSWADEVERVDDAWEFGYTGFGVFRRDVRYGTESTEDGVRVDVAVNDAPHATYEVDVETEDGGTRVLVTGRRASRVHLRAVLFGLVRRDFERRAYEALGYDVERFETEATPFTPGTAP